MTDRKTPVAPKGRTPIDPITHPDDRVNIPTPELAPMMDPAAADPEQTAAARKALSAWTALGEDDVELPLRQKGVDMRIGLDIAAMTFKSQVDTIILVTGDSDFIPAAKIARREGMEFILDPMWQDISDELHEHVDGIASGLDKPKRERAAQ